MTTKKLLALLLAFVMVVGIFAGCAKQPADTTNAPATNAPVGDSDDTPNVEKTGFDIESASELDVTVLGTIQTGNRVPGDDKLTPIWREKTKVIPETVEITEGQTAAQYFQAQILGDTLVDVISVSNGIFDNPENYNFLKNQGVLREITLEDIKTYMPLTCQRLENWGISVEDWYTANCDKTDGKLWYIPSAPNLALTNLRDEEFVQLGNSFEPYSWYFRDDILKQIFPEAKTEAELRELYIRQGYLTFEDVNDVPIYDLEDFYDYLVKVKELNMTAPNGNPVVPAQIQANNDPTALMWSAFTLSGFFWQDLGDRCYDEDTFVYFADTPEWKEYVRWFNKLYNEDLLSEETFIQKDEQRDAKVIAGEYAVFQAWCPVVNAREVGKDNGYGYRKLSLFPDGKLTNDYQNFAVKVASLANNWGAIGLTTSLDEEDIPQVLNWIDWNQSEEANILRTWGPEEFYTGEGKDRRFKDEYADVMKQLVYGIPNEAGKDAVYYGIYSLSGGVDWNHETFGIGGSWGYEYTPSRVYPADTSNPDNINVDNLYSDAVKLYYADKFTQYVEKPLGDDVNALYAKFKEEEEKFTDLKATASFDCDGAKTATIQAIICPPDEFEAKYADYEKFLTDDFRANIVTQGEAFLEYYKLYTEKYLEPVK